MVTLCNLEANTSSAYNDKVTLHSNALNWIKQFQLDHFNNIFLKGDTGEPWLSEPCGKYTISLDNWRVWISEGCKFGYSRELKNRGPDNRGSTVHANVSIVMIQMWYISGLMPDRLFSMGLSGPSGFLPQLSGKWLKDYTIYIRQGSSPLEAVIRYRFSTMNVLIGLDVIERSPMKFG